MKEKIKISTIIRLISLALASANQIFAIFADGSIDFASSEVYQIISIIVSVLVGIVCFWFNNDFTKTARIIGQLFSSVKDGKITAAEIQGIIDAIKNKEIASGDENHKQNEQGEDKNE